MPSSPNRLSRKRVEKAHCPTTSAIPEWRYTTITGLLLVLVRRLHAALAWPPLRDEERTPSSRANRWIAALDGLVVLALSASLLLLAVLVAFPDEHLALDHHGVPVVVMWSGIQLAAVLLAEATARLTFRWLDAPGTISLTVFPAV